jgi:drug/metabolite transporter (DMT)-like permease
VEHRRSGLPLAGRAGSFEVTFWRSLFNALALERRPAGHAWTGALARIGAGILAGLVLRLLLVVMFTAFMLAITLTTVANVLVTMAIGPLITALFTRVFLQSPAAGENLDGDRRSPAWASAGCSGRRRTAACR